MAYIRKFKTKSGSTGVQVCYKVRGKVIKTIHVGSARTPEGIERLTKKAHKVIDGEKKPLFNLEKFDEKNGLENLTE